jgi:hypothetical protein
MPLYRLLQNAAFEPEQTKAMCDAFDELCRELRLAQHDAAQRETVAQLVIEFAQRGEREALKLRAHVLAALKPCKP